MTVSVVIPTYNRARMLPDALASVAAQTHPAHEIIVVDDGSTDDTAEVVARVPGPIRYVRRTNGGVGAARNTGLAHATGRYVAFLDSDDSWHPFKLALQVGLLEALPEVALLYTEFSVLKDDGTSTPKASRTWLREPERLGDLYERTIEASSLGVRVPELAGPIPVHLGQIYRALLDDLPALTSTTIVRRSLLDETVRFAEGVAIFEDWEFFARVAQRGAAAFVDVETAVNRGHAGEERVTKASRLAKAQCYVSLLDRVWKADPAFGRAHPDALRTAEWRGLRAVAREALVSGRTDLARQAVTRWRALSGETRQGLRRLHALCAYMPGGPVVYRAGLRGRTAVRLLVGRPHERYSVNPAA